MPTYNDDDDDDDDDDVDDDGEDDGDDDDDDDDGDDEYYDRYDDEDDPCERCGAEEGEPHLSSCRYHEGPQNLELDYLTRPPQDDDKIDKWLEEVTSTERFVKKLTNMKTIKK